MWSVFVPCYCSYYTAVVRVSFRGGGGEGGERGRLPPLDILCPPLEVIGVEI